MAPSEPRELPPYLQPDPLTVAREWLAGVIDLSKNDTFWDTRILRDHSTVIAASLEPTPRVTSRLKVTTDMCNPMGNLHGGAAATICDDCTSIPLSLVKRPGFWEYGGVSRTINMVYMHAIPDGEELEVTGEVISMGKRLGK